MPVADDANVVSAREKPKSVGITYASQKSLEQIKALCADVVGQMGATPTPLDDGGIMYMDSLKGKSVTLMMMSQQPAGTIVSIDVGL